MAETGRRIGPYRLERRLAEAEAVEVWVAEGRDGTVALKVFRPEHQNNLGTGPQDELRAAKSLSHRGLAEIYDFARTDDGLYLATELIVGPSLAEVLGRLAPSESISPAMIAYVGLHAAEALAHAAEHATLDGYPFRLAHKHLSPSNVFVDVDGRVRVSDFGVAPRDSLPHPLGARPLRGKPNYLAPEQIRGEAGDELSDQFSLGLVLYELAARAPAFPGDDVIVAIDGILNTTLPSLSARVPGFSKPLAAVIDRMIAKERSDRFPSHGELTAALGTVAGALPAMAEAEQSWRDTLGRHFDRGSFTPKTPLRRHHDEPAPALPAPPPRAPSVRPRPAPRIAEPRPASGLVAELNRRLAEPEGRRTAIGVGVGLVVVLALVAVFAGPSDAADQRLRQLFDAGDHARAERYFVEHLGQFRYAESAFALAAEARARRLGWGPPGAPAPPASPTAASPSPAPAEVAPSPAPELFAVEWPEATAPTSGGREAERRFRSAAALYRRAQRAVEVGDASAAAELAEECLKTAELPECHLALGVAADDDGDSPRAVRHLGRYLMLAPGSANAKVIERRIARAEGRPVR